VNRRTKMVFWAVLLALVGWGIYAATGRALADFEQHNFDFSGLNYGRLALAGIVYLLGLLPCCWFWRLTLRAMKQDPTWSSTVRAYYLGHLGKYVPGKALVVILRATAMGGAGVNTGIAAGTVFIETLTMMAVGAFLAAVVLAWLAINAWLTILGIALAAAAMAPTLPPVFRFLVRLLRLEKRIPAELLTWRTILAGWLAMVPCWLLLGTSMLIVVSAVTPVTTPNPLGLEDLPYLTAAVSLAMVAGFLSLLPGGILVRDYVAIEVLAHHAGLGAGVGLVAAIVLRFVWLISEVAISAILYALPTGRTTAAHK